MLSITARLFTSLMDRKGYNYKASEIDNTVITVWNLENNASITILIEFNEMNTNCSISGARFFEVPQEKWGRVLVAVNELNANYRWFKFFISDDAVLIRTDAIISIDTSAEEVMELVERMIEVASEAYVELEKAAA